MPFGTRYTRVEPVHGAPEEIETTPRPMEFSNNIQSTRPLNPPVSPYNNHSSKAVNTSYMERHNNTSSNSSSDLPTYEPYGNQYGTDMPPKRPAARQRTGSSFLNSISYAWTATTDGVSHFRIPKIAAPWEHETPSSEKGGLGSGSGSHEPSKTVREFDHRRQRRRLFVNSSFRLMNTAFLCCALAAVLYGFSTIRTGMTQAQKKGFNALITGLSIILGLNLSSSLKGYAQMMRWRFLAAGYRNLQDFELVMQCESQQAVLRLLWAGRTPGKFHVNKTQALAFLWLLINVALQVTTALLGLTYSIDISDNWVSTKNGNITIANLTEISSAYASDDSVSGQGAQANTYGMAGQDYDVTWDQVFGDYTGSQQSILTNSAEDLYWYSFVDQDEEGKETVLSHRQVSTKATCREYSVLSGGYAGWDDIENGNTLVTIKLDDGTNNTFVVDPQTLGGTTWMVNPDPNSKEGSVCGPRCAITWALQVADNITDSVPIPRFWECNNTVSKVTNVDYYSIGGNQRQFQMPDLQAWIWAGALGYSGSSVTDGAVPDAPSMQYVMYPPYTLWSPSGDVDASYMANKVMQFVSGAISAMDFNSQVRVTVEHQDKPIPAQIVNVEWMWACVVLGVIPLTQAIVLCLVIGFANKAVIKDASFLATARLLRPIVDKLGNRGCLLTGDEIAEELGNPKVVYGPRMPRGTQRGQEAEVLKHIDVISEEEDIERWHGRMPAGRYDGTWEESDAHDGEMELLIQGERTEKVVERRRPLIKRRMSL